MNARPSEITLPKTLFRAHPLIASKLYSPSLKILVTFAVGANKHPQRKTAAQPYVVLPFLHIKRSRLGEFRFYFLDDIRLNHVTNFYVVVVLDGQTTLHM
jgi:hypothetical protein